ARSRKDLAARGQKRERERQREPDRPQDAGADQPRDRQLARVGPQPERQPGRRPAERDRRHRRQRAPRPAGRDRFHPVDRLQERVGRGRRRVHHMISTTPLPPNGYASQPKLWVEASSRREPGGPVCGTASYLTCFETSLVMSNIETCFLPPNTAL